jgi:NADPH:quinone reductase-like Zn-dependent oxidoreductase
MTLRTPAPGHGEVRVKTAAASINLLDWMVADGAMADTALTASRSCWALLAREP